MSLERIFKNIILLHFINFILIFVSILIIEESLLSMEDLFMGGIVPERYLGVYDSILYILVIINYINLILLYRFIQIARTIYLFVNIIFILTSFLDGPVIFSSFQHVIFLVDAIAIGAIIVLMYYSPIKNKFEKKS